MDSSLNLSPSQAQQNLSSKLTELEIKEKEKIVEKQAEAQGLPYISLHKFPVAQDALKLISREQAEALQTVCFLYSGNEIRLASLNPTNPQVGNLIKELGDKYHANVVIYLVSEYSFDEAYQIYEKIPTIIRLEGVQISEEDIKK